MCLVHVHTNVGLVLMTSNDGVTGHFSKTLFSGFGVTVLVVECTYLGRCVCAIHTPRSTSMPTELLVCDLFTFVVVFALIHQYHTVESLELYPPGGIRISG